VADADVRFILLWVAFNSAYASEIDADATNERKSFKAFFDALVSLDSSHYIYDAVWDRFSQEIRLLLANRYVFAPFWHEQNGLHDHDDWEEKLAASQRQIATAMKQFDTGRILLVVFDRLYVLRNQLVHGGATWNSSINRAQVRDRAAVLGWLLPAFINIMLENPARDWGKPFYPVIKEA
jgi:Apea-like HEPN